MDTTSNGPDPDVSPEDGPSVGSQELDAAEADGDEEPAPSDDPASPDASDVPGISPLHDDLPGPGS